MRALETFVLFDANRRCAVRAQPLKLRVNETRNPHTHYSYATEFGDTTTTADLVREKQSPRRYGVFILFFYNKPNSHATRPMAFYFVRTMHTHISRTGRHIFEKRRTESI